ncbi:DUF2612 domain-containing protein [Limnohabitans sp.]|uniref:DUF2612 domain-containing protein n=1 Tax=Limnohabitans sp. TaxID=1907725 RepID=UPI00286F0DDD|nr:DUF2612 domain-containing protein [Limnohabitans sp.]
MNVQTAGQLDPLNLALLWQHSNAPNRAALIAAEQAWLDKFGTGFWSDWQRDVFNLATANEFGLSVWSAILDVNLGLKTTGSPSPSTNFGVGASWQNFGRGNFFATSSGGVATLSTDERRLILQLRYFQLTSRASVSEIGQFVTKLFGGNARILDPQNMSDMTLYLGFQPFSALLSVLHDFDLLPRPAGVGIKVRVQTVPFFGFGLSNGNFGNSFAPSSW